MKARIISALLLIALALCTLVSCGDKAPSYRDDVPVSELCAAADACIDNSEAMAEMAADYISSYMGIDLSNAEEYTVKLQSIGTAIDEYGIFKAPDEAAAADFQKMVNDYFAAYLDRWMPEYRPEELPKLKSASVRVMGRYVVYCILSDADKDEVFAAVENLLLDK